MIKKIIILLSLIFLFFYFFLKNDSNYIIKNKKFIVNEHGSYKMVEGKTEKLLLDKYKAGSIGSLDKFQVDNEHILIHKDEEIYLYNFKDDSFRKIMNVKYHNLNYSKKYKKIIFEKDGFLYKSNIDGAEIEKIGNIAVSVFYNYIVFINDDEFIYQTFTKANDRVVKKYNLKNSSNEISYKVFSKKQCFPVVYLENNNFICHNNSKEHKGFYTIDIISNKVNKLDLNILGKYIYYLKDLNAIFYTKEQFSFKTIERFETRIFFLDTQKDFLWSKKYLQPIEYMQDIERSHN